MTSWADNYKNYKCGMACYVTFDGDAMIKKADKAQWINGNPDHQYGLEYIAYARRLKCGASTEKSAIPTGSAKSDQVTQGRLFICINLRQVKDKSSLFCYDCLDLLFVVHFCSFISSLRCSELKTLWKFKMFHCVMGLWLISPHMCDYFTLRSIVQIELLWSTII